MSQLLNELKNIANNNASNNGSTGDSPKAEILLAIGELREGAPTPHDEGFDAKEHVVNLPQMWGLDNMRPDTRKASTPEFAAKQADSNDFQEDLSADLLAKMQPEDLIVLAFDPKTRFVVTAYRKKEEIVAPTTGRRQRRQYL